MPFAGRAVVCVVLSLCTITAGCSGRLLKPQYEYEEEIYLDLDGSATLNVNASVPALVALRGADLPTDPHARLDRQKVRAFFQRAGANMTLSLSRRHRRRFVHVSVKVDDVRELAAMRAFSWSTYGFDRSADRIDFRQIVGAPVQRSVGHVGWTGDEIVAFRMHLPSEILFSNSQAPVQRGNIVEWDQPLASRLRGEPLELRVQMAPETILYTTLLLFGSTIVAAVAAFAAVLWWMARRGGHPDVAESKV